MSKYAENIESVLRIVCGLGSCREFPTVVVSQLECSLVSFREPEALLGPVSDPINVLQSPRGRSFQFILWP